MLKAIWNIIRKIFSLILSICSTLKRLICRRKRHSSDTLLPLTNQYSIPKDFNQLPSNTQEDLQPWDTWETETKKDAKRNGSMKNSRSMLNSQSEEEEIDFFTEMTPKISKQKKVYIGDKTSSSTSQSNKFAVTSDIPINQGAELGTWEDSENAWGEESMEDLSWQAEAAIKQSRKSEHQKRLQEHQRRKMEREQSKSKKDSNFSAVRLSS